MKSKRFEGDQRWTGPTRAFIQADPDLLLYVRARELERSQLLAPKRQSERFKTLLIAVDQIRDPDLRDLLLRTLERGRAAQRKLDILSKGRDEISAIDIDAILRGNPQQSTTSSSPAVAEHLRLGLASQLSADERRNLTALVDRVLDETEMNRCGLTFRESRLRLTHAPRTTIIRPTEMAALFKLVGRTALPAEAGSASEEARTPNTVNPAQAPNAKQL